MAWYYINQKGDCPEWAWLNQVSPLKRLEAAEGFQIRAIQCSRDLLLLALQKPAGILWTANRDGHVLANNNHKIGTLVS